jgi:DNA-binding SARP family transcriptional activator
VPHCPGGWGKLEIVTGKLAVPRDHRRETVADAVAPPARHCKINLIGAFSVQFDGVGKPVLSRKLRAIVAYLCFRKDGSETRERLAGLLWSERDPDKARASLRQTVRDLHALFGPDAARIVSSSKLAIGLLRGGISVDVDDIMRAAEQGRAHPALLANDQPVATMLSDLEDIDPEFRVWLTAKRRAYTDRIIHLLERTFSAAGTGDAAANAEAVLALDGSHELAARTLMSHYAARGEEARALRIYADLWNLLAEDLDAEPSPATQRLVVEIKRGRGIEREKIGALEAVPRARPIALVVGAAAEPSVGEGSGFQLKAFRDQLIANLVRFREWLVFDEADILRDGQNELHETQFFRVELKALALDPAAAISVALKDSVTGRLLWTEIVDPRDISWADAYSKTIRRIAIALNIHVSSARLKQISEMHSAPPGIYDRWLKAHATMMTYDGARWAEVGDALGEIVRDAPDFSLALRSLAMWSSAHPIAVPGVSRSQESHRTVVDLAWRALELDPADSQAHLCLAWSSALAGEAEGAKAYAAMAVELNTNDIWTLVSAANVMGFCGDVAGAVGAAEMALTTSPLLTRAQLCYLASVQFMNRDYAACVKTLERAGASYPGAMAWKVAALWQLSRREEAAAVLSRTIRDVASRWKGPVLDEGAIFDWLSSQFPILDPEIKGRFTQGLASARALA